MLPYERCIQFKSCSANKCPLDPSMPTRDRLPGEAGCKLAKTRRIRLAAEYSKLLPWRGPWPRELSALERWERMSPEEQEALRARGREMAEQRKIARSGA